MAGFLARDRKIELAPHSRTILVRRLTWHWTDADKRMGLWSSRTTQPIPHRVPFPRTVVEWTGMELYACFLDENGGRWSPPLEEGSGDGFVCVGDAINEARYGDLVGAWTWTPFSIIDARALGNDLNRVFASRRSEAESVRRRFAAFERWCAGDESAALYTSITQWWPDTRRAY